MVHVNSGTFVLASSSSVLILIVFELRNIQISYEYFLNSTQESDTCCVGD